MSGVTELTAFEAEVYDRQIRLWGVDAQHRIRSSRVLVSGLGALGAEVAKNLVLAGVSVTLQDDAAVTTADVGVQFLLRDAHAGMNRATASLPAVRELNPLVDTGCDTRRLSALTDDELSEFRLVVLTNSPPRDWVSLARRLRRLGIPVIAAQLFGFRAAAFLDFGDAHKFTKETKVPVRRAKPAAAPGGAPGAPPATTAAVEYETVVVSGEVRYVALDAVLAAPRAADPKRLARESHLVAAWAWLGFMRAFAEGGGGDAARFAPGALRGVAGAVDSAVAAAGALAVATGSEATRAAFVDPAVVRAFVDFHGVEVVPVAAVVGGVLGAEAIKLLTANREPMSNVLLFDAMGKGATVTEL